VAKYILKFPYFQSMFKRFQRWLSTILAQNNKKYVVRIYDGFDNEWFDTCSPTSYKLAEKLYNQKTENGSKFTSYKHIDYYGIFEVADDYKSTYRFS
jgi:hypothetical protein